MTIFFTSDYHINHFNIIKYCNRPFKNVDEMNEEIIARHNAVVKKDDTVYNLGDFIFNIDNEKGIVRRLNGKQILIYGNHDSIHPANKRFKDKDQQFKIHIRAGWTEVAIEKTLTLKGGKVVRLHHMPYRNEEDVKERHHLHRLKDDAVPLLHGHVHTEYKTSLTKRGTVMINVGVDVWGFTPVCEGQVEEMMKGME